MKSVAESFGGEYYSRKNRIEGGGRTKDMYLDRDYYLYLLSFAITVVLT